MDPEVGAVELAQRGERHLRLGQLDSARRCFQDALDLDRDLTAGVLGLAAVECISGCAAAAAARLQALVDAYPESAPAWTALGDAWFALARYGAALGCYEQVLDLDPQLIDARLGLVACLARRPQLVRRLRSPRHLTGSLDHPDVDPSRLAAAVFVLLKDSGRPLEQPLLRPALRQVLVTDPGLEQALVRTRRRWCLDPPGQAPELAAALADQVALNGFLWPVDDAERAALPTAPAWVRALYEPVGYDEDLQDRAAAVPVVRTVVDELSASVREQYESDPYPVWQRIPRGTPRTLSRDLCVLTQGRWEPPAILSRPEVLVAGCGTGRELLSAAHRWQPRSVTGFDLSRTSLAHAHTHAQRLGIDVDLFQADLLQLDGWQRRFDAIVCTGVLHHLRHPLDGWRILARLLRPGGVMWVGLYSERARRGISAAQEQVRRLGLEPDSDGIRGARQHLFGLPPGHPARDCLLLSDFYSMSGCRDLLFHVHERHFTLPEIAAALEGLGLDLLAFDTAAAPLYRTLFGPVEDLTYWEAFEELFPRTFLGMYQFWCRKAQADSSVDESVRRSHE